jgi:murein DD-endopeptidase MepM/ murein hydrolase activator NlpD
MPAMRWILPSLLALLLPAPEESSVVWRPVTPLQGSLVVLEVRPAAGDSVVAVRGVLAGERLHFERGAGVFRALGAVPLATQDSIMIRVVIERATGDSEALTPSLRVAPRLARREELRTPPEFVQPPESLAAGIEAERALIQEIKRRTHDTPRLWRGSFARPRPGAVTSRFGVTRLFNGKVQSRHFGVDFAGRRGAPVRAANRGVVVFAGRLYYSGTAIFLDHGAGLVTAYFHLSHMTRAVGDTVHRGQVIGHVGSSGRVTGPHLHWHAAYGSVSVDPLALLTIDLPAPGVMQSEAPP